jgi:hypothetical protein
LCTCRPTLPAYSPDYNPIEEAFAKIENLLRKAAGRAKEALVEAIGAALSEISARDARGFFEHAGYRPTAHLLWNVLNNPEPRNDDRLKDYFGSV